MLESASKEIGVGVGVRKNDKVAMGLFLLHPLDQPFASKIPLEFHG